MHFIFYGPEGSGKGTQAKLLSVKLGLPVYTTGDLVRETAAKDNNQLGNVCRKVLTEGKYLPDAKVSKLVENKLTSNEAKKGFILDGFPRTLGQAKFLEETLRKNRYNLDNFIYLKLSDEKAIDRLAKRKRTLFGGSNILHDDLQRVKNRLAVFREKEKEVLKFYRERGLTLEVNGAQSIEAVFGDIILGLHID